MKVTYGIICYNAAFYLRQLLESIYPYAHAICIAEGTVGYFKKKGLVTSDDGTNEILENFPDPDHKIKVIHGTWDEKDSMCKAWFRFVPEDTEYVWCNDADELMTDANREKVFKFLEEKKPTKLGFKSDTFFGGFTHILGGFERDHNFVRVLKYEPGCEYLGHRQPRLGMNGKEIKGGDIDGNTLYELTGVTQWHGSYNVPDAVKQKIDYYENAVISKGNCISKYFERVWLNWVLNPRERDEIEKKFGGVHEFVFPKARGECYTEPFTGEHPEVIIRDMNELIDKFYEQLEKHAST